MQQTDRQTEKDNRQTSSQGQKHRGRQKDCVAVKMSGKDIEKKRVKDAEGKRNEEFRGRKGRGKDRERRKRE